MFMVYTNRCKLYQYFCTDEHHSTTVKDIKANEDDTTHANLLQTQYVYDHNATTLEDKTFTVISRNSVTEVDRGSNGNK